MGGGEKEGATLGRKQIILGSLGRNPPQGHVHKFSDSQAPGRHHSPATCSSSNGSAIANAETGRPDHSFLFGEGPRDLGCPGMGTE